MNLKEKLEKHSIFWVLGLVVTAFGAGLAAYKEFREIAQEAAKSTYESLQQRDGLTPTSPQGAPPATDQRPTEPASTDVEGPPNSDDSFRLSKRLPFPEGLDVVAPGMKLSEAARLLPGGHLTVYGYTVSLKDGPLSDVHFMPSSGTHTSSDPTIGSVRFRFRHDAAHDRVLSTLLRQFSGHVHKSEMLGARICGRV